MGGEGPGESHGVSHSPQHGGRIAPQRAATRQDRYGVRMVLEARHVAHRLAGDVARGPQRGGHTEATAPWFFCARDQHRPSTRAQVEIPEPIHREHVISRPRGRFGEAARRHTRDEHARRRHSSPSRRRACSREIT